MIGNDIITTASFNEYKQKLERVKKCFDSGSRVFFRRLQSEIQPKLAFEIFRSLSRPSDGL